MAIVQIQQAGDIITASPALIVINQDGNGLSAVTINKDYATVPSAPDQPFTEEYSVKLVHSFIKLHPEFGENGHVLADCLTIVPPDEAKLYIVELGPAMIADELSNLWKSEAKLRQFRLLWTDALSCERQAKESTQRMKLIQRLSEYKLNATLVGQQQDKFVLRWEVRHPWGSEAERYSADFGDEIAVDDLKSAKAFGTVAHQFAKQVTKSWGKALKKIGQNANP
ncbi:hypothetical protein QA640_04670 [Bradyrhizobium sp. CB82]|uniref:hypothetical protein n=1 Tax=Bradyrhizobium sp. CB82 TaxID=3039159 RepID=UPI0024B070FF|nr:hypothetical protein [Bradyrhizobium sp. CB82]WFU41806.1 hypothetical protein QA640_04670 [Bradyrhizobium sp. CB82]